MVRGLAKGLHIGAVLDYAAEKDIQDTATTVHDRQFYDRRVAGVVSARTFVYAGEEYCESNLATILAGIEVRTQADGIDAKPKQRCCDFV